MILSYYTQLERAAEKGGIDLLQAYLDAGFPDSTYYRHRQGSHDPRLKSAEKVMRCIAAQFQDRHGVSLDQR